MTDLTVPLVENEEFVVVRIAGCLQLGNQTRGSVRMGPKQARSVAIG